MQRLSVFIVVVAATWSADALACPSCVDPREANVNAFLGSTVALSLIPLAFIFGVVAWVVKHEREANRFALDEEAAVAAVASLPAAASIIIVPPAE